MQLRVSDLIGRVADEIVLEALLMMNDELNSVFMRYERFVKNRDAVLKQQSPQPQSQSVQQVEATTTFNDVSETDVCWVNSYCGVCVVYCVLCMVWYVVCMHVWYVVCMCGVL